MIEKYVPLDRRHDDSHEKFMEERIRKLNNSYQPSMEDSLSFPFEPLGTVPITLLQNRVSNTSSDSEVNFPHVLSPAMTITSDNSQPYLLPSTLRMNPTDGTLTPFQKFNNISRKSKNK